MDANPPGAMLRRKNVQRLTGMLMLLSIMLGLFAAYSQFTNASTAHAATGSVQINAGGPAVAPFGADADFTGGATAASSNTITTGGVSNPAPQSVYQSNRYGNFSYAVPGLTAGTSYTVRLHFAETYWTAVGKRTFNVSLNSQQVLTNFDIFATAGAANTAVVEQFTATASSTGTITIQFATVIDNAQVNGIEVLGGSTPTPTPTAASTGGVQINAGGPAVAPFIADTDFTGGATAASGNTITTSGVSNPAPQAVYQSNRLGNFTYTIPNLSAGASYTVRLHFAETYWTAAGKRTFNVSINSQQVLTNFDIFAAAGGVNIAVVKQFSGTASAAGTITIQFTTVIDNAQVNGIEVLGGGSTSTPTPTPTTGVTATPTPTTNWTPVWRDDFTGSANTAPSASNWIEDTGTSSPGGPANWGTGEVESMSNSTSNVYLDGNGHLNITALNSNGAWTSGRIETQQSSFAAPAGGMMQISASIKQPNPANPLGYWPAFWSLGAANRTGGTWPGVGETDIMEDVNGLSEEAATLHCGVAPGGPCNEYSGIGSGLAACAGCQTAYHTYSEIIDRTHSDEQIRWYLDGQQIGSIKESQVGISAWQAAIDHGFFLILDLAIGGSFPNAACSCTTPNAATSSGGTLSVDYVAVSQTTGTPPSALTAPSVPTGPSVVSVTGTQGNWQLTVNGAPYQIKGVTYGPTADAAGAYMPDLKAEGVNTLRTWGTDATSQPLLDAAAAYGLKVINGFWLNQGTDYLNDTNYKSTTLTSIENWVTTYKNHPGVLMWDVGNEVLLTLQNTYSGTQLEQERNAYAQYVNQIAQAIHSIDPYHPVTSTDAWTGAWPYYKANAPALDLYAVNSYGAVCNVKQDWINGGYTKPYIVTEAGPAGEWEVPNDANGVPTEPTDIQKRDGYTSAWNCIVGHTGVALGATLFNYGIESDFGGVWFNLRTGWSKRLSYYSVGQLYGAQTPTNTPPVISSMSVSQNNVPAGSQFTLNINASDPNNDPMRYSVLYNSKYIDTSTAMSYAQFTQTGSGSFSVTAPQQMGVWKIYIYAYDGQGNVGIDSMSFKVVPPPVSGTNVAIGKTTTASSYQATGTGAPFLPSNATDGNFTTRWATDWSDPQWIEVDLGQTTTINHIQLGWESAYGLAYQIQVSNDGTNWTTIYSTTTGDGGFDDFNVSGSGRYVRMYGTQRGTTYGYSLWEFGIYTA